MATSQSALGSSHRVKGLNDKLSFLLEDFKKIPDLRESTQATTLLLVFISTSGSLSLLLRQERLRLARTGSPPDRLMISRLLWGLTLRDVSC